MVARTISIQSQAELWSIIHNGRQFLEALESFATANFPQQEGGATTTPAVAAATQKRPPTDAFLGISPAKRRRLLNSNNSPGTATATTTTRGTTSGAQPRGKTLQNQPSLPTTVGDTAAAAAITTAGNDETDNDNTTIATTTSTHKPRLDRTILQYNATTGELVGTFETLVDCAKAYAEAHPGSNANGARKAMIRILRGISETYKGFYFRRQRDTSPMPTFPIFGLLSENANNNDHNQETTTTNTPSNKPATKAIIQYCAITGAIQGRFESAIHVARAYVAHQQNNYNKTTSATTARKRVGAVLSGQRPTWKNLYFRRENDTTPMPTFPIPPKKQGKNNKKPKTPKKPIRTSIFTPVGYDDDNEEKNPNDDDNDTDNESWHHALRESIQNDDKFGKGSSNNNDEDDDSDDNDDSEDDSKTGNEKRTSTTTI